MENPKKRASLRPEVKAYSAWLKELRAQDAQAKGEEAVAGELPEKKVREAMKRSLREMRKEREKPAQEKSAEQIKWEERAKELIERGEFDEDILKRAALLSDSEAWWLVRGMETANSVSKGAFKTKKEEIRNTGAWAKHEREKKKSAQKNIKESQKEGALLHVMALLSKYHEAEEIACYGSWHPLKRRSESVRIAHLELPQEKKMNLQLLYNEERLNDEEGITALIRMIRCAKKGECKEMRNVRRGEVRVQRDVISPLWLMRDVTTMMYVIVGELHEVFGFQSKKDAQSKMTRCVEDANAYFGINMRKDHEGGFFIEEEKKEGDYVDPAEKRDEEALTALRKQDIAEAKAIVAEYKENIKEATKKLQKEYENTLEKIYELSEKQKPETALVPQKGFFQRMGDAMRGWMNREDAEKEKQKQEREQDKLREKIYKLCKIIEDILEEDLIVCDAEERWFDFKKEYRSQRDRGDFWQKEAEKYHDEKLDMLLDLRKAILDQENYQKKLEDLKNNRKK